MLAITAFPLYVLIDEYDNFANHDTGLSRRRGVSVVHPRRRLLPQLSSPRLKGGTGPKSAAGLERMFITGVSPITMDDPVTSGFNIGKNISLEPEFNDMLGFTEEEVRKPAGNVPGLWRVGSGGRKLRWK